MNEWKKEREKSRCVTHSLCLPFPKTNETNEGQPQQAHNHQHTLANGPKFVVVVHFLIKKPLKHQQWKKERERESLNFQPSTTH